MSDVKQALEKYQKAINNNKSQSIKKTMRRILNDFGYTRIGTKNTGIIKKYLRDNKIQCHPDIAEIKDINSTITLRKEGYICGKCRCVFNEEPYLSISNKNTYCSWECIPEAGMNKTYSYEYFQLVDIVRDLKEKLAGIGNYTERDEFINELDLAVQQHYDILTSDGEGTFYGELICSLINNLLSIDQEICNFHMNVNKPAICVLYCDVPDKIGDIIGEEVGKYPNWEGNRPYFYLDGRNYMIFENRVFRDKCFSDIIKKLRKYDKEFDVQGSDGFYTLNVRYCEGCGCFEDEDEFTLREEMNWYVCESCIDKNFDL